MNYDIIKADGTLVYTTLAGSAATTAVVKLVVCDLTTYVLDDGTEAALCDTHHALIAEHVVRKTDTTRDRCASCHMHEALTGERERVHYRMVRVLDP